MVRGFEMGSFEPSSRSRGLDGGERGPRGENPLETGKVRGGRGAGGQPTTTNITFATVPSHGYTHGTDISGGTGDSSTVREDDKDMDGDIEFA